MRLQMNRTFKLPRPHYEREKKPHFFNIIFRVYALQSQSIDPKVMQLNRRDRKVSFEKLFCVYVFYYATLQSNEN